LISHFVFSAELAAYPPATQSGQCAWPPESCAAADEAAAAKIKVSSRALFGMAASIAGRLKARLLRMYE
jgi:hypothetical protein